MTHDPETTDPTTPLTNRSTDQSQHDHAITAYPTSRRRPRITNRTAYLGITIRQDKNPDKAPVERRPRGPPPHSFSSHWEPVRAMSGYEGKRNGPRHVRLAS
jgi:hypothetical protein